jgi:hypothetical protein
MTTKELVGPVPTVSFGGGPRRPVSEWGALPKVAYVPPRNTLDPRFAACTEHRVACDCREAEFAEYRQEAQYEARGLQKALDTILAGHATYAVTYTRRVIGWDGDRPVEEYVEAPEAQCLCTGCQIARAIHYYPRGR